MGPNPVTFSKNITSMIIIMIIVIQIKVKLCLGRSQMLLVLPGNDWQMNRSHNKQLRVKAHFR